VTALAAEAHAESPQIELEVPRVCDEAARGFAARVERALGATPAPDVDAFVSIEAHESGYRVTVATRGTATENAEKVLLLPTCDEAVDAAAVVLAFALARRSEEALDEPPAASTRDPATRSTASAPPASPPEVNAPSGPTVVATGGVDRGSEPGSPLLEPPGPSSRASLAAGADLGTLPVPTLTVAAGVSRSFSALELSGVVRYGLPTVSDNVEGGVSESVRRDFGAVELRACYGVGARVHVAACGGGEVGVVRASRRVSGSGVDVDEDEVSPRLSGVVAAQFSHRGGAIHPELELSGAAVALGRQPGASVLALRVAAGAAVEF
jgi:hypothetical protein